jgi:hypothetical protein
MKDKETFYRPTLAAFNLTCNRSERISAYRLGFSKHETAWLVRQSRECPIHSRTLRMSGHFGAVALPNFSGPSGVEHPEPLATRDITVSGLTEESGRSGVRPSASFLQSLEFSVSG